VSRSSSPSDRANRQRPDVADVLRPRSEEESERANGIAAAAQVVAPALVVGAAAVWFIPALDRNAPLIFLGLLTLAPVVLSLAWRPGSGGRARTATATTAIILGLAAGALGLGANPCVADPVTMGVVSALLFTGTLIAAVAIGRQLALEGRRIAPAVAAGLVGLLGFYASLVVVGQNVFVLC
jgi:hypothetical protein